MSSPGASSGGTRGCHRAIAEAHEASPRGPDIVSGCHPPVHILRVLLEVREAGAQSRVEADLVITGFYTEGGFLPSLGSVLCKAWSVARGMLEDGDRVQGSPSAALDGLNILHDDNPS